MPSVSATAAVSRSPAPAATTSDSALITSMVPAPRSTTTACGRAPGVVSAPRRAAAGSLAGERTGTASNSPSRSAGHEACGPTARLSDATSTARPVLPCRAVAASAAAARSTANRSSTSVSPPVAPNARTAPTGQPGRYAHASRNGSRRPSAVWTHGSSGASPAALPGAALPDTALPGAALPGAALPGAALADTVLPGAALADTMLPGAALADTMLPGAALADTMLPGAASRPTTALA